MQTDSIGIATSHNYHQYYYTFILVALLLVLHWSTISSLFVFWWISPTYGHGLLVLPIAAFLIWQRRNRLNSIPLNTSFTALALLLLVQLAWAGAYLTSIAVVQQTALWAIIFLLLWSCLGFQAVKLLWFPLLFPLLAVPLWDPLESLLQILTATSVTYMLKAVNVPAYLDGHYILIPEGRFSIENVCAGLRFFLALLTISSLFAYLNLNSVKNRAIFIAIAVVSAVVTNWVRVFAVIMAGHLTQMQHSLVQDHVSFGWWIFAFMLLPVFALGVYLQKKEQAAIAGTIGDKADKAGKPATAAVSMACDSSRRSKWMPTIAGAGLIVVALPLVVFYFQLQNAHAVLPAISAPPAAMSWSGPHTASGMWRPRFENADDTFLSTYRSGGESVDLFVARYHRQQQDKELINYRNTLAAPAPWTGGENAVRKSLTLNSGESLPVVETDIGSNGRSRLVWYWYVVGGMQTNQPLVTKLLQIREILGSPSGAVIIAVATDVGASKELAGKRLHDFLTNHYHGIRGTLSAL